MKNTNPDFQPLQYAGGLYDADTKLLKFEARDYDPTVGRWTTKDPIGFAGGDTNLYAYVGGNPMSYVDPNGLAKCTYSIKTGRLECSSNDGNMQFATNAFSGGENGSAPLPIGMYTVKPAINWPNSFFSLSRGSFMNTLYRATRGKAVRGGFMVHPGSRSQGCITIDSKNDNDMKNYNNIQNLFQTDVGGSTLEVIGD